LNLTEALIANDVVYVDKEAGRKWVCSLCYERHRNEDGTDWPLMVVFQQFCRPCALTIASRIQAQP
jgi:hypothetical protein